MKYWLYTFGYSFLELPFRTFFRSYHIDGVKNIPKGKPVLFVSNHSGSFLDGVILCYTRLHKLYAVARGDAFNKPLANTLLRSVRLLPIYRSRDAEAGKAREGNARTFDEVYQLFSKHNSRVLIFPEALSVPVKTLKPLKKGAANICADVMMKSGGELDLYVQPMAINFSGFFKMRNRLQVVFGEPISIKERFDQIKNNPRKFGVDFTEDIHDAMVKVVAKTKGDNEEERETAHEMLLNEGDTQMQFRQFNKTSQVAMQLDRVGKEQLPLLKGYKSDLEKYKLTDRAVKGGSFNALSIFIALCTFAVSLPAALLFRLAWALSKRVANKVSKTPVFYDSVYFGVALVLGYLWYPIVIIGCFQFLPDDFTTLTKTVASLLAILGTPHWFVLAEEVKHLAKELRFMGLKKEVRSGLKNQRSQIINSLR